MDVTAYFSLNELPFRISPDPRFLYFSDQVKEALAKCEYMARERIGPIYIYGPIGSGKSKALCFEAIKCAYRNPGVTGLIGAPTQKLLSSSTTLELVATLEERDLIQVFGDKYIKYKQIAPMLIPFVKNKKEG